jgi:hypothetical protein
MMNSEGRIELRPCGRLAFWVYIDGKLMDLVHYSEVQKIVGLKQKTIDAIEQIYDDIVGEEE